jgi:hypothetical protein
VAQTSSTVLTNTTPASSAPSASTPKLGAITFCNPRASSVMAAMK